MQLLLLLGHMNLLLGPQDGDLDQEGDAGLQQLLVESKNHENLLNVRKGMNPNQVKPRG